MEEEDGHESDSALGFVTHEQTHEMTIAGKLEARVCFIVGVSGEEVVARKTPTMKSVKEIHYEMALLHYLPLFRSAQFMVNYCDLQDTVFVFLSPRHLRRHLRFTGDRTARLGRLWRDKEEDF